MHSKNLICAVIGVLVVLNFNCVAFQLTNRAHFLPCELRISSVQIKERKCSFTMKQNQLQTYKLSTRLLNRIELKKIGNIARSAADSSLNSDLGPNAIQRLILLLTNLFPLWVAAGGALGYLRPAALAWMTSERITASLAITMLCMGMTLELDDFKRVLKNPRQV